MELSLLQAKQSQLSQLFLIGEKPSDHLCDLSLDLLQELKVSLVLGVPELDTVLEVRSHESRVEE